MCNLFYYDFVNLCDGWDLILLVGLYFSALYQLHLVKAEKARAYIPKEFKLVEAFGYLLLLIELS